MQSKVWSRHEQYMESLFQTFSVRNVTGEGGEEDREREDGDEQEEDAGEEEQEEDAGEEEQEEDAGEEEQEEDAGEEEQEEDAGEEGVEEEIEKEEEEDAGEEGVEEEIEEEGEEEEEEIEDFHEKCAHDSGACSVYGKVPINDENEHLCLKHFSERVKLERGVSRVNSLLLYTLKACEEDRNKKLLADSMPFVSSLQKYDRYIGEIAENMGDPEVSEVEEDAGEEEQEGVRVEGVPEKNIKNPCACEDCTEDGVIPHVFESKVETEAKDKRWSCVSHFWSKKNKDIKTLITKTLGSLRKINKAILKNGFGPEDAIAVGPTALSMLQDNIHEILTIIDEVKQEEDSEHESPMETDERLDGEAEEGEEEEEQRSPRKKKRRQKAVKVVERGENQERIESFFKSV